MRPSTNLLSLLRTLKKILVPGTLLRRQVSCEGVEEVSEACWSRWDQKIQLYAGATSLRDTTVIFKIRRPRGEPWWIPMAIPMVVSRFRAEWPHEAGTYTKSPASCLGTRASPCSTERISLHQLANIIIMQTQSTTLWHHLDARHRRRDSFGHPRRLIVDDAVEVRPYGHRRVEGVRGGPEVPAHPCASLGLGPRLQN